MYTLVCGLSHNWYIDTLVVVVPYCVYCVVYLWFVMVYHLTTMGTLSSGNVICLTGKTAHHHLHNGELIYEDSFFLVIQYRFWVCNFFFTGILNFFCKNFRLSLQPSLGQHHQERIRTSKWPPRRRREEGAHCLRSPMIEAKFVHSP